MPRKKVVKSAARKKQSTKQTAKSSSSTSLQKIENDFHDAPAKLIDQLNKDIAALQQKENKLATTLSKIQAQADKLTKTIASTQKLKTAAARKQVQAAKKALNSTKKDYAITNAALKTVANQLIEMQISLLKAESLAKLLKHFAKDWPKQVKKLKDKAKQQAAARAKTEAKAKNKAKAKKVKSKRKTSSASGQSGTAPTLTVIEQPAQSHFDTSTDEASEFDDVNEATS